MTQNTPTDVDTLIGRLERDHDRSALDALIVMALATDAHAHRAFSYLQKAVAFEGPMGAMAIEAFKSALASGSEEKRLEVARRVLYLSVDESHSEMSAAAYQTLSTGTLDDVSRLLSRVRNTHPDPAADALSAIVRRDRANAPQRIMAEIDEDTTPAVIGYIRAFEYLPGIPTLDRIAHDYDRPVEDRDEAYAALGYLRSLVTTERLIDLLDSTGLEERWWAATELVREQGLYGELPVDRLCEMSLSQNADARWVADKLLLSINADMLASRYEEWEFDREQRDPAATFEHIVVGHDPEWDVLMSGLLHENPSRRAGALCRLADLVRPGLFGPLYEIAATLLSTEGEAHDVRVAAVRALQTVDSDEWEELLIGCLRDQDPMVRAEARRLLKAARNDSVRWNGVLTLAALGDWDAPLVLVQIIRSQSNPDSLLRQIEVALDQLDAPNFERFVYRLEGIAEYEPEDWPAMRTAQTILERLGPKRWSRRAVGSG